MVKDLRTSYESGNIQNIMDGEIDGESPPDKKPKER